MANKTKKKNINQNNKDKKVDSISLKQNFVTRKQNFYAIIVFVILGFVLYANTITHDYALDDAIVINKNKFTQQGISGIPDIFKYDTFVGFWLSTDSTKTAKQIQNDKKLVAGGRYRPLSLVSFAIETELFGKETYDHNNNFMYNGNPAVSHLNNILLYVLTSIVLYFVLLNLFAKYSDKKWFISLPFITTLLFLAHPIHTEAVANIKGRDEIMTLLGSLSALWFTIKYLDTKKMYHIIVASICLFFGLLSKENAITFLALIPLSVYYFTNHRLKNILKATVPLVIVATVFLVIRASVLGIGGGEKEIASEIMNNPFLNTSFGEKFATIFITLWMYVKLLVFPHPLTYDYYPYQIEIVNWSNSLALFSLFLYLLMGFYALYGMIKKKDVISYSIWFYLIPLSVVSNIFFPVGTFMNERFVFISSIGFCILLAYVLLFFIPKYIKIPNLTIIILLLILSLYSVKTISRNKAWENDFVLFTTDVHTSYNSAKSTCSAGGKLLEEAQKPHIKENKQLHDDYCRDAISYLERSLEIHPEYIDALNLLGNAHFQYNMNVANSLKYYYEVLKRRPGHPVAFNNTNIVLRNAHGLLNSGKSTASADEILVYVLKILEVRPNHAEANHLAGTIYGRYKNDLNTGIKYFKIADSLKLNSAAFYRDFAVSYGLLQDYQNALKYFLKAIDREPNDVQTYYNIAVTYMQIGNVEKANEYFAIYNQKKSD